MKHTKIPNFEVKAFFKAAFPSYFFPFVSSFLPGYFLNKPNLMQASYSSIAFPSLIATIISFGLLWQFQKRQVFIYNRFMLTFILGSVMVVLATIIIEIFNIQIGIWNIILSAFIGTAIVVMTKPLKTIDNYGA